MKMAATWFRRNRGLAIGTLIAALTVGKASPYLVDVFGGAGISFTVLSTSAAGLLAALIIFILPILFYIFATTGIPPSKWIDYFMLILFGGALAFALVLAISKGLPRWSLSYLGFVLMLGIILSSDHFWGWLYPYFVQSFGPMSYWPIPVQIIYSGYSSSSCCFLPC